MSLLALIVLVSFLDKLTGKQKERQDALAFNRQSLDALRTRNELSVTTNRELATIANHLANLAELANFAEWKLRESQ